MEDIQTYQEKQKFPERGDFEATRLHQLSDEQMISLIACPGIIEKFNLESIKLPEAYKMAINPSTQASYEVKEGTMHDKKGQGYNLYLQRDLDSVIIRVDNPQTQNIVLKVCLRDREFDGTMLATPPSFLKKLAGASPDSIPPRTEMLGNLRWYYSESSDRVDENRRAVEISVIASDPDFDLKTTLKTKAKNQLFWVKDGEKFAEFIDNPFSSLPDGNPPDPQKLNEWYSMWWQVTHRVLAGKKTPLPGQTSQYSFLGFLEHAIATSEELLSHLGYSHLSAIPTWHYVWTKFQRLGFQPDQQDIHKVSSEFFDKLSNMQLPHPTRRNEKIIPNDFVNKKELIAWLAVIPYAIQRNPNFIPKLDIPQDQAEQFAEVFEVIHRELVTETNNVETYPLAPRNNTWYSFPLTK